MDLITSQTCVMSLNWTALFVEDHRSTRLENTGFVLNMTSYFISLSFVLFLRCTFGIEIQPQKGTIYNVGKVAMQFQNYIYIYFSITE